MRLLVIIIVTCLIGCQSHPYEAMEQRELTKGIRQDSLIMGLRFGMDLQSFFDHCMELNKQKLVKEGPGNRSVEFIVNEGYKFPVKGLFRPSFHDNQLYQLTLTYSYLGWAPWNKELFAEELIQEVLVNYKDEYSTDFVTIESKDRPVIYATVEGNRRITIGTEGEQNVTVQFTDLLAKKGENDS